MVKFNLEAAKSYFDTPNPKFNLEAAQNYFEPNEVKFQQASLPSDPQDVTPEYTDATVPITQGEEKYKGFWNELKQSFAGSSLNVASGITENVNRMGMTTFGATPGSGIPVYYPPEIRKELEQVYSKPNPTAEKLHEKAKEFQPTGEGGWKGFVARAVGSAFPYIMASTAATAAMGPGGGFLVGYSVEGNEAYMSALEQGASEEDARLNGAIVGTINGAIETLSVSDLIRFAKRGNQGLRALVKAAKDKAWKRVAEAGKDLTLNHLQTITREAVEEAVQETVSIGGEIRINPEGFDTKQAIERITSSALGGGVAGGILGAGGSLALNVREESKPSVIEVADNKTEKIDFTPLEQTEKIDEPSRAGGIFTRFKGLPSSVRGVLINLEEQERQIPKLTAKEEMQKFGKLSNEDSLLIQKHLDNPKKYPDIPERLIPYVKQVEIEKAEAKDILKELGYEADWPNGRIKALEQEFDLTDDPEQRQAIAEAIDQLDGLGYIHRTYMNEPLRKKIATWFKGKKISQKPTGLLGRIYPTLDDAMKAGKKPSHLAVTQANMLHIARKAKLHSEFIKSVNKNPKLALKEDVAPADWVGIDSRLMPASETKMSWIGKDGQVHHRTVRYKYHPAMAEAIKELTWTSNKHALTKLYDKINTSLKMLMFYNPIVMAKNDIFQGWRATGLGFVAKLPQAVKAVATQNETYQEYRRAGLYNNVVDYVPAAKELTQDMLYKIQNRWGKRTALHIAKWVNPQNIVEDVFSLNNKTTWKMDEVLRTAVAMDLQKGMFGSFQKRNNLTNYETIEQANDFMANYGKVPKHTRQVMNRWFFTPTYKISMMRVLGQMVAQPQKFWPQLARHIAYKMFVKYVLPGLVASWVIGDWKAGRSEKGYKIILKDKRGKERVYSLSDPLLEEVKLTQRPILQTFEYNLSAALTLGHQLLSKPKYGQQKDRIGRFFKLGTPVLRDIENMTDAERPVAERILTQLAIAYVYTRKKGKDYEDDDTAVESFAKAMSIWTDWKMQKEYLQKTLSNPQKKKKKF